MKDHSEQHVELSVELEHDPIKSEDCNALVINKGKHHLRFHKLANPDDRHTITWTLTGNASDGEFCELHEKDHPGFAWLVRTPDKRIFHRLERVLKNKLTIHNHHLDESSEGVWHYQLFARIGDKVYGVPLTFTAGGANSPNPSIKNN